MAVEIADLAVDLHIGDGNIVEAVKVVDPVQQLRLVGFRQRGIVLNLLPHLLLHGLSHRDGAFQVPAEGVLHREVCRLTVRYAVNLAEGSPGLADIDGIDLRVPLAHIRRNDVIDAIVGNLAAFLSHDNVIEFQIGVGLIRDGDAGGGIGAQVPRADEVVRRHIDIAAAGGDVRNLHIIDGTAGVAIDPISVRILLRQSKTLHVLLDAVALRDIGRHHFGSAVRAVVPVIGGNQFVQFLQACAQGIGIVKGSLGDAVLHPIVGVVVWRRDRQPIRHAAADGQVDGIGGAGDEGAGDGHLAGFRHSLFRHDRVGGQELLVRAGAALDPVKQAFVLGDFFPAAAGDDVDVPGGAHRTADIHHAIIRMVVVFHRGGRNGDGGMVIGPCLEVDVQI